MCLKSLSFLFSLAYYSKSSSTWWQWGLQIQSLKCGIKHVIQILTLQSCHYDVLIDHSNSLENKIKHYKMILIENP